MKSMIAAALIAAAAASCQAVVPALSCGEWQGLSEHERIDAATSVVRAKSLLDAVRIGQQVEPELTGDALYAMAASSVTKVCELEGWRHDMSVGSVVDSLYAGRTN